MRQASARSKSASSSSQRGRERSAKFGSFTKQNRVKPVGTTQVVHSSTSKTNVSKKSFLDSKQRNASANATKKYEARNSPVAKKAKQKSKYATEEDELDDQLLRESLRMDGGQQNKSDQRINGNEGKAMWSHAYQDIQQNIQIQAPHRKSAWAVRRNENPVGPITSDAIEKDHDKGKSCEIESDVSSSDGSCFDTDLEEEFPEKRSQEDQTSEEIYIRACKGKDVASPIFDIFKYNLYLEDGIVPVSCLLKKFNELEILIPHHGLGPENTKALACALVNNVSVETLDVTDNDLQAEGGIGIASMLYENIYITDLNLSENFLHAPGGLAIAKALLTNNTIKRLVLKGNHLTDKVAIAFAETLKENRTLAELDLSYNEFGETGGLYLGAGLSLNYGLQKLNLKWNSISGKGAISIAHALGTNESLTFLDVSWNHFGHTGSLALSANLPKNDCLKQINLSNNHIGQNAAIKLSHAFAKHPHLFEIKLGMNPIGVDGAEAIFDAVFENPRIRHIGLEDVSVPISLLPRIEQLQSERNAVIITDKQMMKSTVEKQKAGLDILMEFVRENALRLRDIFYQLDKDRSGDISRQEFKTGLKELGILMDAKQLNSLIKEMDIDKNNKIDYSEILSGHKTARQRKRRQTVAAMKLEKREAEALNVPELNIIKSNLSLLV